MAEQSHPTPPAPRADLFIVNVAFDDIGRDFHGVSLSDLSWVLNGYAIVYAALLVPLGRLADRFGRKPGFLLGLAVFTGASLACALSVGPWMLVGFRMLQAAGAALLTPTSLGLLVSATPPAQRVRAVRIWAATGALAAAVGPAVGGVLVEASWRWVFLVNLPIGVAALVFAVRLVPDSRDEKIGRIPDLLGAGVLALSIGALALGLVKGPDWGWGAPNTIVALVVAVVGTGLFWTRSLRHPLPVAEPALLKVRAFAWSNATSLLFSIGFAANLLVAILWMQQVWGYSAIQTGLGIAPGPLMVPIFAAVAQSIAGRVPVGRIAAFGCVLVGVGSLLVLTSVGPTPHYVTELLPGWLIGGIGVGFALPTILSAATADLPPDRSATGSAVVNMSRQVGTVIGVSLLVALLGRPIGFDDVHSSFQRVWLAVTMATLLAAVTALGMTPRIDSEPASGRPRVPAVTEPERTVELSA
jgi:EmrB/QacA subfamily drug resistance transporter